MRFKRKLNNIYYEHEKDKKEKEKDKNITESYYRTEYNDNKDDDKPQEINNKRKGQDFIVIS